MPKKRYVKICPNCGATDFGPAVGLFKNYQAGYDLPPALSSGIQNECNVCGFRGTFPEVEEKGVAVLQRRIMNNKGKLSKRLWKIRNKEIKKDWKKFNPKLIPVFNISGVFFILSGIYYMSKENLGLYLLSWVIGFILLMIGIFSYLGKKNAEKE